MRHLLVVALVLAACSSSPSPGNEPPVSDAGSVPDAGSEITPDAGEPADAGEITPDAGMADAGDSDAGMADAGTPETPDAGDPFMPSTTDLAILNASFEEPVLSGAGAWQAGTPAGWLADTHGCALGTLRPGTAQVSSVDPLSLPAEGSQVAAFVCSAGATYSAIWQPLDATVEAARDYAVSIAVGRRLDTSEASVVTLGLGWLDESAQLHPLESQSIDVFQKITDGQFATLTLNWRANGAPAGLGRPLVLSVTGLLSGGPGGMQVLVDNLRATVTTLDPSKAWDLSFKNPSFESPELAPGGLTAVHDVGPGWTCTGNCFTQLFRPTSASVATAEPLASPGSGSKAAILFCNAQLGNAGVIATSSTPTTAGRTYEAHLAVAGRMDTVPMGSVSMTLEVEQPNGSFVQIGQQGVDTSTFLDGVFQDLVATGTAQTSGRLRVTILSGAQQTYRQILIDNLRVTSPQ